MSDPSDIQLSRRSFLQLAGATGVAATAAPFVAKAADLKRGVALEKAAFTSADAVSSDFESEWSSAHGEDRAASFAPRLPARKHAHDRHQKRL